MEEVFDVAAEKAAAEQATFELQVARADLFKALRTIGGVIESAQILPILSHVKLEATEAELTLYATDSEVELVSTVPLRIPVNQPVAVTVPGKKLLEVCRTLPDDSLISLICSNNWVKIKASGNIEFDLSALPANGFPLIKLQQESSTYKIQEDKIYSLLSGCAFAMAQHDVRHFLNGMFFSFSGTDIKITATDGHRLAIDSVATSLQQECGIKSAIVPRKAVLELIRLMESTESDIDVTVTEQHIKITTEKFMLSTRLLEGSYPDCQRLIPDLNGEKAVVSRLLFKDALNRAAVLAKEKYSGVRLAFSSGTLKVSANNSDNERAQESFSIDYHGGDIVMAFNISYLLDVINVLATGNIVFILSDPKKHVLIQAVGSDEDSSALYVVMPMTL